MQDNPPPQLGRLLRPSALLLPPAAAGWAAWAVAEVEREAAERAAAGAPEPIVECPSAELAAAPSSAELEPETPSPPAGADVPEPAHDPAHWDRRRSLWQMHHQKSTVLAREGGSARDLGDILAAGSEGGDDDAGSTASGDSLPPALGDSASSWERRRVARKAQQQAEEAARKLPAEVPRPAVGIRCA